MKPGRCNLSTGATESVVDDEDKRACFVTNSGSESGENSKLDEESEEFESDEECKLPFSFPSSA
jgi:hypothetical protein